MSSSSASAPSPDIETFNHEIDELFSSIPSSVYDASDVIKYYKILVNLLNGVYAFNNKINISILTESDRKDLSDRISKSSKIVNSMNYYFKKFCEDVENINYTARDTIKALDDKIQPPLNGIGMDLTAKLRSINRNINSITNLFHLQHAVIDLYDTFNYIKRQKEKAGKLIDDSVINYITSINNVVKTRHEMIISSIKKSDPAIKENDIEYASTCLEYFNDINEMIRDISTSSSSSAAASASTTSPGRKRHPRSTRRRSIRRRI